MDYNRRKLKNDPRMNWVSQWDVKVRECLCFSHPELFGEGDLKSGGKQWHETSSYRSLLLGMKKRCDFKPLVGHGFSFELPNGFRIQEPTRSRSIMHGGTKL